MKPFYFLLAGIVLGGALGWFAGYLNLPEIPSEPTFLIGLLSGLAAMAVLAALLLFLWRLWYVWRLRQTPFPDYPRQLLLTAGTSSLTIALLVAMAAALLISYFSFHQIRQIRKELARQQQRLVEQAELIESVRSGNLIGLMNNMLDDIRQQAQPGIPLSESLISRLAALSSTLRPYRYVNNDSLQARPVSPERAQLLVALLNLNLDTLQLSQILGSVTFDGADLGGIDLSYAYLSGASLNGANLRDANLRHARLAGTQLRQADLWGADLSFATLAGADLHRANLRWSRIAETSLQQAILDGADLTNAQIVRSNLSNASAQFANWSGVIVSDTRLSRSNLRGSRIIQASLRNADFTRADLRMANFTQTDLKFARLTLALVDSSWAANIVRWRLPDRDAITMAYTLVNDTADSRNNPLYRLRNN